MPPDRAATAVASFRVEPTDGDREVEATNLESHRSKQCIVQLGFREDPFHACFGQVSDAGRRSPAVGQGYLARAVAVEGSFERALTGLTLAGKPFQALSCGAGFDSSYFRLRNAGVIGEKCSYFEVDYPKVVEEKIGTLLKNSVLMGVCLNGSKSYSRDREGNIRVGNYRLLACDLSKTGELEGKLLKFGLDFRLPTVVLCECSLTYVAAAQATLLYRWLAASFPDVHLILYEQIGPSDRFGRIMKAHFRSRATPLLNVDHFPTPLDQERRLRSVGFASSRSVDLCSIMSRRFGPEERERRGRVEPDFDEYEEFFLKCAHYTIAEGHSKQHMFEDSVIASHYDVEEGASVNFIVKPCSPHLSRYGHSCLLHQGSLLVLGGTSLYRGRDSLCVRFSLPNVIQGPLETFPLEFSTTMFSATCLVGNDIFLFGGRGKPGETSSAVWKINALTRTQEKFQCSGDAPKGRWRHTMATVGNSLIVVGGKDEKEVFSDMHSLDMKKARWKRLPDIDGGIHSHSACADKNGKLLISGGLDHDQQIISDVRAINCETGKVTIHKLEKLMPRFSHTSTMWNGKLILVGGVAVFQPGVSVICVKTWQVNNYSIDIPSSIGFYNHSMVREDDKLHVFGGGGNCFSFGMHMTTEVLTIDLADLVRESTEE